MTRMLLVAALAVICFARAGHAELCIEVTGSKATNNCGACREITLHELRPVAQRQSGLFSGTERTIKLEHGQSETLPGSGGWVLRNMVACH